MQCFLYAAEVRVLGIDPGTRHLGWAIVESQANRVVHCAHGVINTDTTAELAVRLVQIEAELKEVISRYKPSQASIETLFFHKDLTAASKLGHARGVALLCCARAGLNIAEYQPTLIKQCIVGTGRADKSQVAWMVTRLLSLVETPPADAADALAIALTHLRRAPMQRALVERAEKNPGLQKLLKVAQKDRTAERVKALVASKGRRPAR